VAVGHEDGAYTMAMYFTSEEAAREGERKEPPPQLKAQMEEMTNFSTGEPEFFDLKDPGSTHPDEQTGRAPSHRVSHSGGGRGSPTASPASPGRSRLPTVS
jgi:hypothetical protein